MNEMINEKESATEFNIQELLEVCLRRWKLIVVCILIGAIGAFGFSLFCMTPMYRAGIKVYVNNRVLETESDDKKINSSDLSASIYLVKDYQIVSVSDSVLQVVREKLDEDYTIGQLKSVITTQEEKDTSMFYLYVTMANPKEAARVANAMADVIPAENPKIIRGTSAYVVDRAKVPTGRYSPSYTRNAVLGAAAGLLAAVVYVTIVYLRDTRIKDENDLTDMFDIPILGRIPQFTNETAGHYGYKAETK